MVFHREKQKVSANDFLQALAAGDEIQLSRCTVTGQLDVARLFSSDEKFDVSSLAFEKSNERILVTFDQAIVCDQCVFEENVVFSGSWSKPDSIVVEFKSDVVFNSSIFQGQTRFRGAVFHGLASFDGGTFEGVVTFKQALFQKDAKFRTVSFHGYVLAADAKFESNARFTNTHFSKGINLTSVTFGRATDFSGAFSSNRAVPSFNNLHFGLKRFGDDEDFWRFVKQSATEAGYYQLAGESFYRERSARLCNRMYGNAYAKLSTMQKAWRMFKGIRLLPEFLFGKLLFGYGERPVRVLFAAALIVLICAVFFSQPGALVYRSEQTQASFWQGLYFSTISFTTLGYGDLYPAPHGPYRMIAMLEAVSGGCLMALFVVCLAKKFSRG